MINSDSFPRLARRAARLLRGAPGRMNRGTTTMAPGTPPREDPAAWLDLEAIARVRVTSGNGVHPIEAALRPAPSAGWRAAEPGDQAIWVDFHAPQRIRQISLGFIIAEPRAHEFVLTWSDDGGVRYRQIARQQFNFSPTTTREDENYFVHLDAATDLKLAIRPDISAGARVHATLNYLRLR